MLLSRQRGCSLCKRMRCRVGLMQDMPVSLTRCGKLSLRQVPVPRGHMVYSAWRLLDAPLGVQALPLPVLRVVGRLPTSDQESLHVTQRFNNSCLVVVATSQAWLSAPTRASQSVSVTANRGRHTIQRR